MIRNDALTIPLLAVSHPPTEVERDTLANAGDLTVPQARWLQRSMVFHGVCGGSREASRSPLADPNKLSDAMRALDATREPLSAAQKGRVRAFVQEVHTAALARPVARAAFSQATHRGPPPLTRQVQLTHERR